MQKVVSISLNGNSYQLEEPGYIQLRDYLERADSRLEDSPDRTEVMADLEQAFGEKCRSMLGPHKTVVTAAEVERIIHEMGPVESADQKTASDNAAADGTGTAPPVFAAPPRKRLFQIREGAMWTGVCNGIAAYLNVDVTWVRIAFVLLTIFTSGVWLVLYLVLMFIVPVATTAEDRAAAFGMPFNTEELITRAKKNFEEFGQTYRWRREWRRQQRQWNRQFRHMNEQLRMSAANALPPMSHAARTMMAVLLPVAAIIGAVFFVGWVLATMSVIAHQSIFGWDLPHGVPVWVAVLTLVLTYMVIAGILKLARQGGPHASRRHHAGWAALHSIMWMGFTILLFWAAYRFLPGVRELMDQLMWAADLTVTTIQETIV